MEINNHVGTLVEVVLSVKKLCKVYSSLDDDEWDNLPDTTNLVESINHQIAPGNAKAVSLKSLIKYFYLEDTGCM